MKTQSILVGLVAMMAGYTMHIAAQPSERGPSKVAFISANRVLAAAPDARAAVGKFQAAQQQRVADLNARQRALQEIRRQVAAAPEGDARAQLEAKAQQQQAELEKLVAQAQADLQASQREMQTVLQAHLQPVLNEVARGQNIDVVLNSDVAVFWGNAQLDITPAVLERLNARKPEAAPKP